MSFCKSTYESSIRPMKRTSYQPLTLIRMHYEYNPPPRTEGVKDGKTGSILYASRVSTPVKHSSKDTDIEYRNPCRSIYVKVRSAVNAVF